ncbi:MAG: hypothetical protein MJ187_00885 [Alphaproteobacteria bacterium]|nr:hypothetical protein [Alphaproteobacteria bacterium]
MFKYIYYMLGIFFISFDAFAAIDLSNCEQIGHEVGTYNVSFCKTEQICKDDFSGLPDDFARCMSQVKTPEDCERDIAKRNTDIANKNLLYRCPATDELLTQKNKPKTAANHHLVYNDGTKMDINDLIADTQNVYIFKASAGLAGFLDKGRLNVIGPADKDGLFMSIYSE